MTRWLWLPLSVVLMAFAGVACNDDDGDDDDLDGSALVGSATKGPVRNGEMRVYEFLNSGARGELIGSGSTDSDGDFRIELDDSDFDGAVWIEVIGGLYTSEATGADVAVDPDEPLVGIALVEDGEADASVSMLSHIAAYRARHLAADPLIGAEAAIAAARQMVESLYGIADPLGLEPADLTAGPVSAGDAAEYGALLGGLSSLATLVPDDELELLEGLARDAADGILDGRFLGAPVTLPSGAVLAADSGYAALGNQIRAFLDTNPRNVSGLTSSDVSVDDALLDFEGEPNVPLPGPPAVTSIAPTSGPAGEDAEIVVTGRNLLDVEVLAGGQLVTVTERADDRLVFTIPAGNAGAIDLEFRDPGTGLSLVLPGGFERVGPAPPDVVSIDPGHGPIAGGTWLVIRGTGFTGDTTVAIDGAAATIVDRDLPGRLTVLTPPHAAGIVEVAVTNPQGTDTATFEYREVDAGVDLPEDAVHGPYRVFGFARTQGSGLVTSDLDFVFAPDRMLSIDGEVLTRTPATPAGTPETIGEDLTHRLFSSGPLVLDLGDDEVVSGRLNGDADVFVASRAAIPGAAGILVGVRELSGDLGAAPDLTGTWALRGTGGTYAPAALSASAIDLTGWLHLDAGGGGSITTLTVEVNGVTAVVVERTSLVDWTVANDGTLSITTSHGLEIEGAVTSRGDFAAGLYARTPLGERGIVSLVRTSRAGAARDLAGSWVGSVFTQRFEPGPTGPLRFFTAADVVLVGDLDGDVVVSSEERRVQDFGPVGSDEVGAFVRNGRFFVDPTGNVVPANGGDVPLTGGAVSASGRFLLLSRGPGPVTPESTVGLGVLLNEPTFFSPASIAGDFNFVAETRLLDRSSTTPSAVAGVRSSVGTVSFDPTAPAIVEGRDFDFGRTAFSGDAEMRTIDRDGTLLFSGADVMRGPRTGGVIVAGDGRTILFLDQDQAAQTGTFGFVEDPLDLAVGTVNPAGDVVVFGGPVQGSGALTQVFLVRPPVAAPTFSGDFLTGGVSLGVEDPMLSGSGTLFREEVFGVTSIGTGTFDTALDVARRSEATADQFSTATESGTFVFDPNGSVRFFGAGGLPARTGFVSPTGDAVFLVDRSPFDPGVSTRSGLSVLLRRNQSPSAFQSPGTFRLFGTNDSFDPITTPATTSFAGSGGFVATTPGVSAPNPFLTGATMDAFGSSTTFVNTSRPLSRSGFFFPQSALSITDTGLATAGFGTPTPLRGGFADTGRFFFFSGPTTSDPATATTSGFRFGTRR